MSDPLQKLIRLSENVYDDDLEQYLKLDLYELGELKMKYGKNKDRSFEEIAELETPEDEKYCRWVIQNQKKITDKNPSLYLFKEYLLRFIKENKENLKM
eukprot:gene1098-10613_t